MAEEKPDSSLGWFKHLAEGIKDTASTLKTEYEASTFAKKVVETSQQVKQKLDDTGVTDKAVRAYEATQDHLDAVSGAKILRLVEERLEIQARYNDILATKLAEALQRLDALERQLDSARRRMKIEEFAGRYEVETRPNRSVINRWTTEKRVARLFGTPVFAGVMIADIWHNGSLLDRLPYQVQAGFRELMGERADSRAEMVERLVQEARQGDAHLEGLLSKIQGQIGENDFVRSIGNIAQLAPSGSQSGWDVVVHRGEVNQYVQVKVYADPDEVIERIQELQGRIVTGTVTGIDGEVVQSIDVAVNHDIFDAVQERVAQLGLDTTVLDTGVERDDIRAALEGAAENATEPFENFFGELLGGIASTTAVHAAVNGFLVWKGAKSRAEAAEDAAYSSAISAGGMVAALGTEALAEELVLGQLDSAVAVLSGPVGGVVSMAAGIYIRGVLRRVAERRHVVERLESGNGQLDALCARVAQ